MNKHKKRNKKTILIILLFLFLFSYGCNRLKNRNTNAKETITENNSSPQALSTASNPPSSSPTEGEDLTYKLPHGNYTVEVVEILTLKDDKRNREIPLKIYYPKEEGKYPAIIFSHGAGGNKDIYKYIGEFWASHGYVCIHPTHYGSDTSILTRGDRTGNIKKIKECADHPQQWTARTQDIVFILDSINKVEEQIPGSKEKIDNENIGMAGHSYGAHTTMLMAGALIDLPGKPDQNLGDKRLKAFLSLSPMGAGSMGLDGNSWKNISSPFMTMLGNQGLDGTRAFTFYQPYQGMPAGDKYRIFIPNAHHMTFSGVGGGNKPLDPKHIEYIKISSIAFWDCYLKGDKKAKDYLQSDKLQQYGGNGIEYNRK